MFGDEHGNLRLDVLANPPAARPPNQRVDAPGDANLRDPNAAL